MSSRREWLRLGDIVENIEAVEDYLQGATLDTFLADRKTIDAVERCLQRVTEAVIKSVRSVGRLSIPGSGSNACAASAMYCATITTS